MKDYFFYFFHCFMKTKIFDSTENSPIYEITIIGQGMIFFWFCIFYTTYNAFFVITTFQLCDQLNVLKLDIKI